VNSNRVGRSPGGVRPSCAMVGRWARTRGCCGTHTQLDPADPHPLSAYLPGGRRCERTPCGAMACVPRPRRQTAAGRQAARRPRSANREPQTKSLGNRQLLIRRRV